MSGQYLRVELHRPAGRLVTWAVTLKRKPGNWRLKRPRVVHLNGSAEPLPARERAWFHEVVRGLLESGKSLEEAAAELSARARDESAGN